jgi:thiamine-phosphate pyrophosphorylase
MGADAPPRVFVRAGAEEGRIGVVIRDAAARRASFVEECVQSARDGWVLVKGDAERARLAAARGVHLGGAPWPKATADSGRRTADGWTLMVALHHDAEITAALALGATAALVSPIFDTPGKGPARGVSALARARALAPGLHLYALGGVTPANARACISAGATGVAVIRALLDAPSPAENWRALLFAVL